jgi:hypothetical protein
MMPDIYLIYLHCELPARLYYDYHYHYYYHDYNYYYYDNYYYYYYDNYKKNFTLNMITSWIN